MSWAIWITGIPGSGKSALARAAAAELSSLGEPVRVLELDEIRNTLTPTPAYTDAERDVVYRCLAYMATILTEARVPVIVDATAHRRVWRDLARASIPRFAEVELHCPLGIARERERKRVGGHAPRGIYARAGQPGATVPGVDVPYEPSLAPDLVVNTATEIIPKAAAKIVALARRLEFPAFARPAPVATMWAVWITGLPGSGKTTLALTVAEMLSLRGVRIKVLDPARLRHEFLLNAAGSERERDIVNRALIYTAKLLTESGVAVIVDATGARRAWRETARALIAHFAEVELVCPREICLERERAVRWNLGPGRETVHRRAATVAPEIVLDYERSLGADLTLHTDVKDCRTAVDEVLRLIQRLQRGTTVHPQRLQRRTQ